MERNGGIVVRDVVVNDCVFLLLFLVFIILFFCVKCLRPAIDNAARSFLVTVIPTVRGGFGRVGWFVVNRWTERENVRGRTVLRVWEVRVRIQVSR